jgi:glyoxylase I family protein
MANTNKAIGGGGFHHVAIRSANWEASVKFYKEVLGCVEKVRWDAGNDQAIMLDTGDGNYIEIFSNGAKGPKPEGNIIHYAIRTDDIDAAIKRVQAAGATIIHQPKTVDFVNAKPGPVTVRVAFFQGPDGEIIEFFQSDVL